MQKLAGAVLVEECGEGVDLMEHHVKEAHAAAHHSIKTEAGPAAHCLGEASWVPSLALVCLSLLWHKAKTTGQGYTVTWR
eukprot:3460522-Amphidinium_carterae.2